MGQGAVDARGNARARLMGGVRFVVRAKRIETMGIKSAYISIGPRQNYPSRRPWFAAIISMNIVDIT